MRLKFLDTGKWGVGESETHLCGEQKPMDSSPGRTV